jgi:hypothetical protein
MGSRPEGERTIRMAARSLRQMIGAESAQTKARRTCRKSRSSSMRFIAFGLGMALLLATSAASAAGGVGIKGDPGDKGGLGPATSTESGASGTAESTTTLDTTQQPFGGSSTQNPDVAGKKRIDEKAWEVGATFETHRLLEQNFNTEGTGPFKVFNVLFAVAKYAFTDYDTVLVSGGGYQYFLADSGESGFRAADITLAYTRLFLLPAKFRLRATLGATIPISFDSQLASNITSPSLSLSLSRRFGDLAVEARVSARGFIDRYSSSDSLNAPSTGDGSGAGTPNVMFAAGAAISAEYDMPFYRPLSAGVALTDSYSWFYNDVGQCPSGAGEQSAQGTSGPDATACATTSNPQTDNQPWQQSYGGEVFVRYVMPEISGFKTDLTVALANGDPSLGYPSVLHDGVVHPYLLYYNSAEVYAALSARY